MRSTSAGTPRSQLARAEGLAVSRRVWTSADPSSIPILWTILVPYTFWALLIDQAPFKGGRPKRWARRFPLWKYFCREYCRRSTADSRILSMQVSSVAGTKSKP